MSEKIENIFAELGLTQYLDTFVDQGFDAWDTILDIQESDLDALGVNSATEGYVALASLPRLCEADPTVSKKLQRRIANARGIASTALLASTNTAADETDGHQRAPGGTEGGIEGAVVTKRKYRRHPKPDENAPERPSSAYVIFSNKMREEFKGQNLSFTEIAKLVGDHWQSLDPALKGAYESEANIARQEYRRALAEYKQTAKYQEYAEYLQEFKKKHANQQKGHDAPKRPKLEKPEAPRPRKDSSSSNNSSSSSGSGSLTPTEMSETESGSERPQRSEPPPTRRKSVGSRASKTASQPSPAAPTPDLQFNSTEKSRPSPHAAHLESVSQNMHTRSLVVHNRPK